MAKDEWQVTGIERLPNEAFADLLADLTDSGGGQAETASALPQPVVDQLMSEDEEDLAGMGIL